VTDEIPQQTSINIYEYDVAAEFRDRKPDRMSNAEYLAFLMDSAASVPEESEAIAKAVVEALRGELSPDRDAIRDAARSGTKQAIREVEE
jgi:hypothetical protein